MNEEEEESAKTDRNENINLKKKKKTLCERVGAPNKIKHSNSKEYDEDYEEKEQLVSINSSARAIIVT